jgi:L-amino acid N-acyltransferase YncA
MSFLGRLFGGDMRVAEQAAAQHVEPLEYPATFSFSGEELTLRPVVEGDAATMLAFTTALPQHDLLFLRRDITTEDNVHAWIEDATAGRYQTVLALHESSIIGYSTVASEGITWTRHVAELRILVAPEWRGRGLGRLLTEQAFAAARQSGFKKMIAQMTTDQGGAIRAFRRLGFEREAVLRNQVIDRDGGLHDLQIMSLNVDAFEAKLHSMLLASQHSDLGV